MIAEGFGRDSGSLGYSPCGCRGTSCHATDDREAGFTLLELTIVLAVFGLLATIGLAAYSSFHERTMKAEADAAWQELSMAVNLHRIAHGDWPEPGIDADDLQHLTSPWGDLGENLANANRPADKKTGYHIREDGQVCVWVQGVPSSFNDAECQ